MQHPKQWSVYSLVPCVLAGSRILFLQSAERQPTALRTPSTALHTAHRLRNLTVQIRCQNEKHKGSCEKLEESTIRPTFNKNRHFLDGSSPGQTSVNGYRATGNSKKLKYTWQSFRDRIIASICSSRTRKPKPPADLLQPIPKPDFDLWKPPCYFSLGVDTVEENPRNSVGARFIVEEEDGFSLVPFNSLPLFSCPLYNCVCFVLANPNMTNRGYDLG